MDYNVYWNRQFGAADVMFPCDPKHPFGGQVCTGKQIFFS